MGAHCCQLHEYATCECYGLRPPQLLAMLWCGVVSGGGLFTEGIFRLAPDAAEVPRRTPSLHPWGSARAVAPTVQQQQRPRCRSNQPKGRRTRTLWLQLWTSTPLEVK